MRERTHPPVHPGRILREHHIEPLGIRITDLATILGVSRKTVSKLVNERGAITPDMALRLSRACDTTPGLWAGLQQQYDMWHAAHDSADWKRVNPVRVHMP